MDELDLRTMPSWKLAERFSDLNDELNSLERAMAEFGKGSGKELRARRDSMRLRILEIKKELEKRREVRVLTTFS